MNNKLLLAAMAAMLAAPASAEQFRVTSPNGLTYVDVQVANGRATYSAGYRQVTKAKKKGSAPDTTDVALLEASPLGLKSNIGDWTHDLQLKSHQRSAVRKNYELRQGKQAHISYSANALTLSLQAGRRHQFDIHFEVSDCNIAFRYHIPPQGQTAAIVVTEEATGFDLPAGTTAFICPQSDPMVGWMRTKPSYEENYIWDQPATTRSQYGHGWTFPCLFHEGDKGWVLISETGVGSDYCASHLSDATPDGLFTIAFPMQGENNGFGSTGAQMGLMTEKVSPNAQLAGCTPWRTITLGKTLKPIVETTVIWDVVDPLYEPSTNYKGSRNTWSWIIWQDPSINYKDQVAYIDLAAALGWEGCLIDGGWYQNIGREGMQKLFAYCKQKGVRPWVWYNSNGGWSDAPQCARNAMHNPIARKKEMKWLRDGGVAGIKVDFFAGDKQETMRLYEAILSDANDYGIQVIFHGCTLPRGWERMYPNYCGSEAVLASENLVFSQGFCDMEARHATLHPFVRNTVGAMEYGGTVLQKRLNRDPQKGNTRRTSDVFELATAIAFQSSGQNFALTPLNLTEQPAFELDFMRQVPTTWAETRFIDGYPGKYIVMARKASSEAKRPGAWYLIAMNAEPTAKTLTITPSVLGADAAQTFTTLLHDGADGQKPQSSPLKLDKKGRITVTIQPQRAIVIF